MYLLVLNVELRSVDHTNDAKPDWDHWQQRGSRTKQETSTQCVSSRVHKATGLYTDMNTVLHDRWILAFDIFLS